MHDIRLIRDDPAGFDRALARRGLVPAAGDLVTLDQARRDHLLRLQDAQARRNAASKDIGQALARKDKTEAERLKSEVASLKTLIQSGEEAERGLTHKLDQALSVLPNLPLDEVPDGKDETGNREVRRWGTPGSFGFTPRQHFEIGEALGLMDFEAATRIAGARFVVMTGALARLERALAQFMLDLQTGEHGYAECSVPYLVKSDAMFGTGQLPKFADDLFQVNSGTSDSLRTEWHQLTSQSLQSLADENKLNLVNIAYTVSSVLDAFESDQARTQRWLIPTAEVSLANLVREQTLSEDDLPLRFTAYTPCFRAEAGAAGRDTRGMIRQHQFSKVELVSITTPQGSRDELERMTTCAEEVLRQLDLPYRVMLLCAGDMGFSARMTYDLEVWLPGQNAYREISSCSACGDFQARRMAARYRPKDGKGLSHVHTLNGSGLAVGRTLIAVMETYQNADGSVTVPDVLKPYMGGLDRIARAGG